MIFEEETYTTDEANRKFGAIKEYDENTMKVDLKNNAACIQVRERIISGEYTVFCSRSLFIRC